MEYNFLKRAMGLFVSSYDHLTFIGGSFEDCSDEQEFENYNTDSGNTELQTFNFGRMQQVTYISGIMSAVLTAQLIFSKYVTFSVPIKDEK